MQDPGHAPARTTRPTGLDDPRAVEILSTEHWGLLSTRALATQEMIGRATIFIAIVSATVVAVALLAQAVQFGREAMWLALLLVAVALFIGLVTFVRSVALSFDDARCVAGMELVRRAYLEMVPGLAPYFIQTSDRRALAHGSPQRIRNVTRSLTTLSGVVAALNSALAGALAGGVVALSGPPVIYATVGAIVSLASAVVHARYAASFRRRHAPISSSSPISDRSEGRSRREAAATTQ